MPWGGLDALGTKLLHLQAARAAGRQQPSHLGVINPYSPLAAFLPFTTYCLKLKRGGKRREGAVKKKKKREIGRVEGKRVEDDRGPTFSLIPADGEKHNSTFAK